MHKAVKGLRFVLGLSSRANQAMAPHRTYTQIAFLELEKARLRKEEDNVRRRAAAVAERIRKIDEQQAELLALVGRPQNGEHTEAADASPVKDAGGGHGRAMQIKY